MRHVHATHDLYNHIGSGKTADWVSIVCLAWQSVMKITSSAPMMSSNYQHR